MNDWFMSDASQEPFPVTPLVPPKRALPYELIPRSRLPTPLARILYGGPPAPSREEWTRVSRALWQGDPPMDRVVAWMFDGSPGAAKALFEQALTRGIETVEDPPPPLADFFALVDQPPPWLDRALLDEGAKTAQASGLVSFYVLRDFALMGGYARFNSMNQTLSATGTLAKDAARRLGETGKWLADVAKPNGLDRFGDGFISTIRVRMVHALVRRSVLKRNDWDVETWGLPINQVDMLATYLAFGPMAVIGARLFGVPIGRRESRAVIHLWRYIGWLSGVEEPWLARTERDGLRKLHYARLTHQLPDEKVRLLGTALLNEPLTRRLPRLERFPRLARLVRRYLYHKHLSNAVLLLGPTERRRLGLPLWAVPWYPLLSAPLRFIVHGWYRLRGRTGLEQLRRRGLAQQQRLLASYFGDGEASLIQPTRDHPAHVD